MSTVTAIIEARERRQPVQASFWARFGMIVATGQVDMLLPILSEPEGAGRAFATIMHSR